MHLSPTVANIVEPATLLMARRSRELRAQGRDIIDLSLGEPDHDPPAFALEAAHEALRGPWHKYTPVNGYLDLRESISHKFQRDNGLTYAPDQIVVSTGAKQSIMNVVMSLVGPGDEVVIPAPYWVSYSEQVRLAGGTPVIWCIPPWMRIGSPRWSASRPPSPPARACSCSARRATPAGRC
jgi:aspartate aminotransferase